MTIEKAHKNKPVQGPAPQAGEGNGQNNPIGQEDD